MAAEVSGNDDTWLYGDDDKSKNKENEPIADGSPEKKDADKEIKENGEPSVPGEDDLGDSDSDSDDDDTVQVTIGDLKTSPAAYGYGATPHGAQPVNVTLKRGPYTHGKPMENVRKPAEGGGGLSTGEMVASSVDSVGQINGVSSLDFNLESLEEKEWRKPGADITDFFNYGFNEETWKLYCERQKRIRGETGANLGQSNKIISGGNFNQQQERRSMPYANRTPVQPRKSSGTIDVIGQNMASRRTHEYDANVDHKHNTIQVMGGGNRNPPGRNPNSGIPDMSLPPPMFSMPPPPQQSNMAVVPTYDSFSAAAAPHHPEFYGGGGGRGGEADGYYNAATAGGYDPDTQWHGAQFQAWNTVQYFVTSSPIPSPLPSPHRTLKSAPSRPRSAPSKPTKYEGIYLLPLPTRCP